MGIFLLPNKLQNYDSSISAICKKEIGCHHWNFETTIIVIQRVKLNWNDVSMMMFIVNMMNIEYEFPNLNVYLTILI